MPQVAAAWKLRACLALWAAPTASGHRMGSWRGGTGPYRLFWPVSMGFNAAPGKELASDPNPFKKVPFF